MMTTEFYIGLGLGVLVGLYFVDFLAEKTPNIHKWLVDNKYIQEGEQDLTL